MLFLYTVSVQYEFQQLSKQNQTDI